MLALVYGLPFFHLLDSTHTHQTHRALSQLLGTASTATAVVPASARALHYIRDLPDIPEQPCAWV